MYAKKNSVPEKKKMTESGRNAEGNSAPEEGPTW